MRCALYVDIYLLLSKWRQAELMQSRTPLGGGPSRNRCPRCSPHRPHTSSLLLLFCTASEAMSGRPEEVVKGTPSMVLEKAGQPEPDSYMSSELYLRRDVERNCKRAQAFHGI